MILNPSSLRFGTHTLQQSTTLKAHTMRASDKMDSCNIRAALQILQTSVRAPQNTQTAAQAHSPVAFDTDEHEIARKKKNAMCSGQAGCCEILASGWRNADTAAIGRSEGRPAVLREWWAPGPGQWFHTAQRSCPRNQSQGSKCRSRAHESFAQLRWQRS